MVLQSHPLDQKAKDGVTVKSWFKDKHSEDDVRELFINIDKTMKYAHENGCFIKSFDPDEITILDDSVGNINIIFSTLLRLPENDYRFKSELIKEDIFNSSVLQILLYSKFPLTTPPDFIRDNFDAFCIFLPQSDIPYYRGVIMRGASVYFIEYDTSRVEREIKALEKATSEIGEAAFLNVLIYPTIFIVLILIFTFICFILKYFVFF